MTADLKRVVSAGLVWSFVQLWGVRVIGFAQLVIVTRLLSLEDIGMISLAISIVAILEGLVDLGLNEAIQQLPGLEELHLRSAFLCILVTAVVMFLLLLIAAPVLGAARGREFLLYLLPVLALSLPINASVTVPNAMFMRNMEYKALAYRSILSSTAGAVVGISAAVAGFAYWSIALRMLVEALLGCLLTWRASSWRPALGFSARHMRELMTTGMSIFLMRTLSLVSTRVDTLILGIRVLPAELGSYATAQRAYNVMMDSLFGAVNQVTLPAFSRIRDDAARSARVLIQVARATSYATFPAFAVAAVLADDLVVLVYGARWQSSGPILAAFCVGGFLFSISFFNATMLTAVGKAKVALALVALNAVTNLAAFIYGSRYGALGVAIAFVARGYLVYPINLLAMQRAIGLQPSRYAAALVPSAVCAVGAAFTAHVVRVEVASMHIALRLACSAGAAAVVYALLCVVFFRSQTRGTLNELSSVHPAFARASVWFGAPAPEGS